MAIQSVSAGRGLEWLKGAIELVMKNPVAFLVMALIFMVIAIVAQFIPLIGSIAFIVFTPALTAGMVWAVREQAEGRTAEIGHLFAPFQMPGKLTPLLMLCLPAIAAAVVGAVIGFLLLGGAVLGGASAVAGGSDMAALASLGGGLALFVLIMLAIGLAVYALILFAIPRVLFDGVEPIAAMQESLSASMSNIAALLVYGLVMFGAYLVSSVILIIPLLGILVWFVIALGFVAANAAAMYLAYVDVFGGPGQSAVPAPVTPPGPPSAPPGPPPM